MLAEPGRVSQYADFQGFPLKGAASVLGATLVVMIAFTYGFTVSLIFATLTYLAAYLLMSTRKAW